MSPHSSLLTSWLTIISSGHLLLSALPGFQSLTTRKCHSSGQWTVQCIYCVRTSVRVSQCHSVRDNQITLELYYYYCHKGILREQTIHTVQSLLSQCVLIIPLWLVPVIKLGGDGRVSTITSIMSDRPSRHGIQRQINTAGQSSQLGDRRGLSRDMQI